MRECNKSSGWTGLMCIKLIFLANREEPFFVWKIKIKWSSSRVVNLEPSRRHHLMNLFIYPSSFFHSNPNYGSSSALANANAYNQQFGPNGFGASAANAGAQAFQAQGPLGGFGASASNAQSQGFQAGPNGITVRYLKTFNWYCYIRFFWFWIFRVQLASQAVNHTTYRMDRPSLSHMQMEFPSELMADPQSARATQSLSRRRIIDSWGLAEIV